MADQKKSYSDAAPGPNEVFTIRTMKKDIERLRQGLPLLETSYIGTPVPPGNIQTATRRLATEVQAHHPDELPPPESAMKLPVQTNPQPVVEPPRENIAPPAPPVFTVRPKAPHPADPNSRPIETMQGQAKPVLPTVPQGGKIVVERAGYEKEAGAGNKTVVALTLFSRIFPTRKRLFIGIAVFLIFFVVGTYGLFAAFGKPLPGTKFVFDMFPGQTSPSPTVSPVATATPSAVPSPEATPSASPEVSMVPTPTPNTVNLPISRLAILTLNKDTTALDITDYLGGLTRVAQKQGDFMRVSIQHEVNGSPIALDEFFSLLGIPAPTALFAELTQELTVFFYAPKDLTIAHATKANLSHAGLLVPIKGSVETLRTILRQWETTMGGDVSPLGLGREWRPGQNPLFEGTVYQGTPIRYQNLPDPYLAADYAIFEGSVPPLLLITTSRESMYATIGTLNYQAE